jgi:hypothetical protein
VDPPAVAVLHNVAVRESAARTVAVVACRSEPLLLRELVE